MNVLKQHFDWAASQGLISRQQADALWAALEERSSEKSFNLANVAYYMGAMIVIGAMGWLMNQGWEQFGGGAMSLLATLYALLFVIAGRHLWFKEKLTVPGGLLFTMAVCMTPLAIYGLERATGVWPQGNPGVYQGFHFWVKGSWFFMEIGTVAAGLVALKLIRFPFLSAPIAFALWYLSMDLTPLFFGKDEFIYAERLWVSVVFGLVMLGATYMIDRRTDQDYAYWGYLFGLLAFWGGLSLMESGSEFNKFLYCIINVWLIFLSVFLDRKVFLVFGALGVNGYLGYLAYRVFENSALFPFALAFLGVSVIYAGLQYHRNRNRIESSILGATPQVIRELRPTNRGSSASPK